MNKISDVSESRMGAFDDLFEIFEKNPIWARQIAQGIKYIDSDVGYIVKKMDDRYINIHDFVIEIAYQIPVDKLNLEALIRTQGSGCEKIRRLAASLAAKIPVNLIDVNCLNFFRGDQDDDIVNLVADLDYRTERFKERLTEKSNHILNILGF